MSTKKIFLLDSPPMLAPDFYRLWRAFNTAGPFFPLASIAHPLMGAVLKYNSQMCRQQARIDAIKRCVNVPLD